MQRTLYFITRHLDVRGGRQDEFVANWYLGSKKEHVSLGDSERRIVVIHGYRERFPDEHADLNLIGHFRQAIDACISTSGEHGILCHTFNQNLPLRQVFSDFAFACTYSIGDGKGEWRLIEALIHTFDDDHKIARQDAFEAAFDALWSFFKPDTTLRQELEAKHNKLAENVVGAPPALSAKYSNHTQHYLLIWNTISGDWFAQELGKYLKTINDNKGLRLELVTSHAAYESVDWSVNWRKVFVLAELYWSDKDWEGIPLIFDLLKKRDGDDQPLEILTCSAFSRYALYESVKDKDHLIVKAFPHLQLKDAPDFSLLSRMYVSKRKWKYKQIELLDNREILHSLLHQIQHIRADNFSTSVKRLYNEISSLRSVLDNRTWLAAIELNESNSVEVPYNLIEKLREAIEALLKRLDAKEQPEPIPGRIMVVEDDDLTRKKISELFSGWFMDVVAFDNGPAALKELRRNAIQYDALIADLELLDEDGLEDTVQGVDLIDFCEHHARWIARRVVTGLDQHTLPRRLTAFGSNRIILKQRPNPSSEEVLFVLPDLDKQKFMKDLSEEIKKLSHSIKGDMPGPSNGVFAAAKPGRESPDLRAYYYDQKINNLENYEFRLYEVFQKARSFMHNSNLNPINTRFKRIEDKTRASWEPLLWDLLTLRLIAIARQIRERKINYIDYGDDSGLYFDLGFKATPERNESKPSAFRQWFNTKLGFSFEPELAEHGVRIELDLSDDELFPHEQALKKDGAIENFIRLGDNFSHECCGQILEGINKVLDTIDVENSQEPAVALMRTFSPDSLLADLRIILKYLRDYPGNKGLRKSVEDIRTALENDVDNRDGELYLPAWLEDILYEF